jgi:transcription termination factor Rho
MFELSALKQMKLAELQEIAKLAKIKSAGVKKELLVQQILEKQNASNVVDVVKDVKPKADAPAKKTRIIPNRKRAVRG